METNFVKNADLAQKTYLTTDEVAEVLNVSPKTVRRWHYIGELKGRKIGNRLVRYRWDDITNWLEARKN